MTEIEKILGQNVKNLRKKLGLTQSELAEKCELSLYAIQAVEAGRNWPTKNTAQKISLALGLNDPAPLYQSRTTDEKFSINEAMKIVANALGTKTPIIKNQPQISNPEVGQDLIDELVEYLKTCSLGKAQAVRAILKPDSMRMPLSKKNIINE